MPNEKLTDEEKRNLEIVREWANLYSTYGLTSRLIDKIYADTCEVFVPLQGVYYARLRKSKENWKTLEVEIEKLFKKRHMEVVSTLARDNKVALEAKVTMTTVNGKTYETRFAAFLMFKDGRIIKDHTYMRTWGLVPRESVTPEFKRALEKVLENQ